MSRQVTVKPELPDDLARLHLPPAVKRLQRSVVARAENRCEYCQLSQEGQEATFHFDHVVPQAGRLVGAF